VKTLEYTTDRKCGECGGALIFDHISHKGTTVAVYLDRLPYPTKIKQAVHRNTRMPFLWVYFKCPKCDWTLCTTNRSKDVAVRG